MNAQLLVLVQLQEVDSELQRLEATKGDLPHRVNALRSRKEALDARVVELREGLEGAKQERSRAESDFELLKEQKAKYQKQLLTVRNNREYDAVTAEIEAAERGLDQLETKIIELLEAESRYKSELEKAEKELSSVAGELEQVEKALQEKTRLIESEQQRLSSQRERLLLQIERPLLASYERIRRAKGGLAVVPVARGACGGCFTQIPAQRALEIRAGDRIFTCEVCGRYLYWKDDTYSGSR
ncbi:MAG: C4-type zinc ribbon domain-containing protein [candidate division KSB1 bacterium]|nr:C4-type zinc ribbon domain-containing protein [candidate division KSB1 bacterium]